MIIIITWGLLDVTTWAEVVSDIVFASVTCVGVGDQTVLTKGGNARLKYLVYLVPPWTATGTSGQS